MREMVEQSGQVGRMVQRMLEELRAQDETDSEPLPTMKELRSDIDAARKHRNRRVRVAAAKGDRTRLFGVAEGRILPQSQSPEARTVQVEALWVDPSSRLRGLGRLLLDAVWSWGQERGCEAARINVSVAGAGLPALQRLGVEPDGSIPWPPRG